MKSLLAVVMLSCSSFVFGCSGAAPTTDSASPTDTSADEAAVTAETSSLSISGKFESVGKSSLDLPKSYTFKSSGKYTAGDSESGTWKLAKVEKQLKITLNEGSDKEESYFFSHSTNTITFNKTLQGSTQFFFNSSWNKKIGIGDVCQDDSGKSLGECSDSGNFGCSEVGFADGVYACNPLD